MKYVCTENTDTKRHIASCLVNPESPGVIHLYFCMKEIKALAKVLLKMKFYIYV